MKDNVEIGYVYFMISSDLEETDFKNKVFTTLQSVGAIRESHDAPKFKIEKLDEIPVDGKYVYKFRADYHELEDILNHGFGQWVHASECVAMVLAEAFHNKVVSVSSGSNMTEDRCANYTDLEPKLNTLIQNNNFMPGDKA